MELSAATRVGFPRDLVFVTYRDKLPETVPFLPNVSSIVVEERRDEGDRTYLLNRWTGKTELPALARRLVKAEMLTWLDRAAWDRSRWACDWQIETAAFPGLLECAGTTLFEEAEGVTLLRISGKLLLHLEKAHVPRLLAGTMEPLLERLVTGGLTPNLLSTGKGVEQYLLSQTSS